MKMVKLALVCPCFNEEEVLAKSLSVLEVLLEGLVTKGRIHPDSFILLVDDGSTDQTLEIAVRGSEQSKGRVQVLELERNFGHQGAILAGILEVAAEVDCSITIDVDLQDDISVIEDMLDCFAGGVEIVYGVRNSRKSDSFFKRTTAQLFYRISAVLGVKSLYNHADFRLMGRRSMEALRGFSETNLFLRALIYQMGFPYAVVNYARKERELGESKYPLRKMLSFAWNGVTSFSTVPLRFITLMGAGVFLLSILGIVLVIFQKLRGDTVWGWSSLSVIVLFLGGIQLLSLGIIGEYLGKVFMESKRRPTYARYRRFRNDPS